MPVSHTPNTFTHHPSTDRARCTQNNFCLYASRYSYAKRRHISIDSAVFFLFRIHGQRTDGRTERQPDRRQNEHGTRPVRITDRLHCMCDATKKVSVLRRIIYDDENVRCDQQLTGGRCSVYSVCINNIGLYRGYGENWRRKLWGAGARASPLISNNMFFFQSTFELHSVSPATLCGYLSKHFTICDSSCCSSVVAT